MFPAAHPRSLLKWRPALLHPRVLPAAGKDDKAPSNVLLLFLRFLLVRLQRSGAEHVYPCGDDRDGDDNSRKAEEDIGQDTADKGRQDPVQDICDIVP